MDAAGGRFVPGIYPAGRSGYRSCHENPNALAPACGRRLGLAAAVPAAAQKAVFVVRHAEKISEEDQRLSEAGHSRAERLARMLAGSGISAIYATDTERARDTAAPLAGKARS